RLQLLVGAGRQRGGGELLGPGDQDRLVELAGQHGGGHRGHGERGGGQRALAERLLGQLGAGDAGRSVEVGAGSAGDAYAPGLVEAEVLLGRGGQAAAGQVRPLLGERVVAGLGEAGGERGPGRLGLVVVVVEGGPPHRVRQRAGHARRRGQHAFADQRGGRDHLHGRARRHLGGQREVVEAGVV